MVVGEVQLGYGNKVTRRWATERVVNAANRSTALLIIPAWSYNLMVHQLAGKAVLEISQMEGVHDLTMKVRGPLAQALKAEADGNVAEAETKLAKAIEVEGAA